MIEINKEAYLDALVAVWKEHDREMLQAFVNLDGCKASSAQVAEILGKSSLVVVNGGFGKLGRSVAEYLNITLPERYTGEPIWYRTLAEGEMEKGSFKWQLRPAFVAALEEFGIRKSESFLPEELHDDLKEYVEGAKKQITVNAYERSTEARNKCIKKFGPVCQVCDFDFEHVYGELGKGFIHVHHLEPMAAKTREYKVDPEKDLIPVCPNCHAMLHKENPPVSVEKLREIVSKNKLRAI